MTENDPKPGLFRSKTVIFYPRIHHFSYNKRRDFLDNSRIPANFSYGIMIILPNSEGPRCHLLRNSYHKRRELLEK